MLTELQQQEEKDSPKRRGRPVFPPSLAWKLSPSAPLCTDVWCFPVRKAKKKLGKWNSCLFFYAVLPSQHIWSIFEVAARMLRIMLFVFGATLGEQKFVRLAQKGSGPRERGRARVKAVCSVDRVGWFLWPFHAECVSWAVFFFSMWVDWLSIFGVWFYLFDASLYADTNLLQFSSVMGDKF